MNWLENMNNAINYIEKNLEGKVDYEKVAQSACCSIYQFQRLFSYMANIPLSEYIRRRKMTLAAFELQNSKTKVKIIDLALKYGYDSPEAFTRAFQLLHGITPTQARKRGINIKVFPRISFQITIKGAVEMNYKIVQREAFEVYGIERIFDTKEGENLKEIPKFWSEIMENGEYNKLMNSANYPSTLNAVCGYENIEGSTFPYMICCIKTPLSDTNDYKIINVPSATWAIFTNEVHDMEQTSKAVQELIGRVYTEWLPTSNYKIIEGFEFEMYYDTIDGKCYEEAWYRVTEKK